MMRDLSNLRGVLDETARQIVEAEPDPDQWDTPILYLLEALESASLEPDDLDGYLRMLDRVRDTITDRIEGEGW
jgi:hypothetical protein